MLTEYSLGVVPQRAVDRKQLISGAVVEDSGASPDITQMLPVGELL